MSEENNLEKIKKFWPKDAPDVTNVPKYVKKYEKDLIVIKYGGNVLIDRNIFNNFIQDISVLNKLGLSIVIVHGGGPRIERELKKSNIQSEFINGLRWGDLFLFLGIQKINPILLITYLLRDKVFQFLVLIIVIRRVVGGLGGYNQCELRKILGYSRIRHLG